MDGDVSTNVWMLLILLICNGYSSYAISMSHLLKCREMELQDFKLGAFQVISKNKEVFY